MSKETVIQPLCFGKTLTVSVLRHTEGKRCVYELKQNFYIGLSSVYTMPKSVYNALIAWQAQIDNEQGIQP